MLDIYIHVHTYLLTFLLITAIIDAPAGQVTLGASVPNGLQQKGVDTITECIKKCVSAGAGIPPVVPVSKRASVSSSAATSVEEAVNRD